MLLLLLPLILQLWQRLQLLAVFVLLKRIKLHSSEVKQRSLKKGILYLFVDASH